MSARHVAMLQKLVVNDSRKSLQSKTLRPCGLLGVSVQRCDYLRRRVPHRRANEAGVLGMKEFTDAVVAG